MKLKIKKLNSLKSTFNIVMFYGGFAVGKYTVAEEFQKQTGYKFFHNHYTYDLAKEFFERGTIHMDRLCEQLRLDVFKELASAKLNIVATHAYSAHFVSKTGLTDPAFVRKVQSIVEKAGGQIYFVHLFAEPTVLVKRVIGKSRSKFKKLTDPKIMKEILKEEKGWKISAQVHNNIRIDNTNLSPKQVVKKVRDLIHI